METFEKTAEIGNIRLNEMVEYMKMKMKKEIIIIYPSSQYSPFDAIIVIDGKKYLVEYKKRNFDLFYLKLFYDNEFILEVQKHNELVNIMKSKDMDGIIYVNEVSDGKMVLNNITKVKSDSEEIKSKKTTCGFQNRITKEIYKININDSIILSID